MHSKTWWQALLRPVMLQPRRSPRTRQGQKKRKSRLVIIHDLFIMKNNPHVEIEIESFSSLKFSHLYLSGPIPHDLTFLQLDETPAMRAIRVCINNVITHVNENGGWTVVGWYKKGSINDVSNTGHDVQVESSEIVYHAVSLVPTVRPTDAVFNAMKYDTTQLEGLGGVV